MVDLMHNSSLPPSLMAMERERRGRTLAQPTTAPETDGTLDGAKSRWVVVRKRWIWWNWSWAPRGDGDMEWRRCGEDENIGILLSAERDWPKMPPKSLHIARVGLKVPGDPTLGAAPATHTLDSLTIVHIETKANEARKIMILLIFRATPGASLYILSYWQG